MSQSASRPSRRRTLLITAAVILLVVGGTVLAVTLSMNRESTAPGIDTPASPHPSDSAVPNDSDENTEGGTVEPTPAFGSVLPETMGGEEAIDALGDNIETVARRNGKTVEELTELLLRDTTAKISPEGFIVYRDSFENEE
ncbi:hypothetical protein ACFUPZ_18685 [Microbacterium oxydans]|uniref:hypothetical protein n=1 Tax=Microbacterium oxydans TaxID=82380 RepID=UPI0036377257